MKLDGYSWKIIQAEQEYDYYILRLEMLGQEKDLYLKCRYEESIQYLLDTRLEIQFGKVGHGGTEVFCLGVPIMRNFDAVETDETYYHFLGGWKERLQAAMQKLKPKKAQFRRMLEL